MRRSLDELSLPVHRVVKIDSQSGGRNLFYFFNAIFFIDCYVQTFFGKKTTFYPKIWGENFQSALLNPLGRSTGNNFSFKGGQTESTLSEQA